jgi:hypothetical protein
MRLSLDEKRSESGRRCIHPIQSDETCPVQTVVTRNVDGRTVQTREVGPNGQNAARYSRMGIAVRSPRSPTRTATWRRVRRRSKRMPEHAWPRVGSANRPQREHEYRCRSTRKKGRSRARPP